MNDQNISQEQVAIDNLAHLAWCALVALRCAQRDGQAQPPLMEHAFLLRWLTTAQKQRRFPRSVTPDVEALIVLGRQKGVAARLYQRLTSLWESCSLSVKQQSDLFRLFCIIDALKAKGWVNAVIADDEWDISALLAEYPNDSVLLVKKSDLVRHFAEDGQLIGEVTFLMKGEPDTATVALDTYPLHYTIHTDHDDYSMLTLHPD
ncbi:hypothetical protein DL121_17395 [Salmonella enterica subsp. enterica]|nr:hypothetical protein [Salmonella enterica subsp. enterica]